MAEKLEDLNLPLAVVSRLVKEALPDNIAISKEAKLGLAKVASVFVLYVTSAATNVAKGKGSKDKTKTLNGDHILKAMEDIEFDKFVPILQESLKAYKKSQQLKKSSKKEADKSNIEEENETVEDE